MRNTKVFRQFFETERAGGIVLIFVTLLSLVIANSPWQEAYLAFWNIEFNDHTITHWINDGLMTIFFLLIGLELEREVYQGELSSIKKASLPVVAAIGGMLVPAAIYLLFNYGTTTQSGAGISMATDIAFAIGILSLLGNRVPVSLKIFLTALAVIDDLGAILIIAFFYTSSLAWDNLLIALAVFAVLLVLNRLKVHNLIPYLIGGVVMWYFMLHSGVHATITGVLLAFAIPFGSGKEGTTSIVLQHFLHKPVAFFILPIFAAANTCLVIDDRWMASFTHTSSIGILLGLIVGKPLGIWLFSFLGVSVGLCTLPSDLKWKNIVGAGMLGGIGFTMSIFITLLAFDDVQVVNHSKMAILAASFLAGVIGFLFLNSTLKKTSLK